MDWNFTIDLGALAKELVYDPKNPLLFNNGFFVLFFGLFIGLYYFFRNHFAIRRYIFCAFSLYFFYKASGYFVGLVIVSALVNYWLSHRIYLTRRQGRGLFYLLLGVVFNLALLFYFKYTNFFISLSNSFFSTQFNSLHILLPIGISFYTFENLSYTIDVYRGDFKPAKRFSEYLLFLSFFPKLMMGPIVRAHDFVPQINKPYFVSQHDFAKGFYLIVSGLIKKLIISDYITLNFVNYIFDDPARYTGLENLLAVYAYAIVIYCDFSGYSDIAIGIAKWLGFDIPPNFLSPYQSRNITEFWRRWHISLSSWLKDYLYIPLGGNRKGSIATWIFALMFFTGLYFGSMHLLGLSSLYAILACLAVFVLFILPALMTGKAKGLAANMNLLTTMLLGGFWHGASFNFIIWGAMHGVALAVHKIWLLLTNKLLGDFKENFIYRSVMMLITFHFVCFCWIFFKASDFEAATAMIHQISNDFSLSVWGAFYENYRTVLYMIGIGFVLHLLPDGWADRFIGGLSHAPLLAYVLVFFLFVVLYGFFKSSAPVMPIYLQF